MTLRFILRIKVTLALSQPGTYETVELEERELRIIASNESQRRLAMSKYTEAVDRARTRTRNTARLPSPPPSPTETSNKGKGMRRPHTSAGPRDAAREAARTVARRPVPATTRPRGGRAHTGLPPEGDPEGEPWEDEKSRWQVGSGSGESSGSTVSTQSGWQGGDASAESSRSTVRSMSSMRSRWQGGTVGGGESSGSTVRSVPSTRSFFGVSLTSSPLSSPTTTTSSSSSATSMVPPVPSPPPETVQAWEEELERIAAQSRRRSVGMLGFNAERRTRPRIDGSRKT